MMLKIVIFLWHVVVASETDYTNMPFTAMC